MRHDVAGAVLLTPSLLAQAAALTGELAVVIERSRDLLWLVHRRRSVGARRVRHIGGGSDDAGLVVAMITGVALCLECVSDKSGVPAPRVAMMLTTVAGTISLVVATRRCDACLETRRTYRLDAAPARPGATRPRGTQHAIMSFLTQRAGEGFCADCITRRLFTGKNIDVAMRHLEGNGVHRRHARCSACGKLRLVAGLPSAN
jgi:hypothetical protein